MNLYKYNKYKHKYLILKKLKGGGLIQSYFHIKSVDTNKIQTIFQTILITDIYNNINNINNFFNNLVNTDYKYIYISYGCLQKNCNINDIPTYDITNYNNCSIPYLYSYDGKNTDINIIVINNNNVTEIKDLNVYIKEIFFYNKNKKIDIKSIYKFKHNYIFTTKTELNIQYTNKPSTTSTE